MSDGFYRAFEERWRGSRDLIKSRLRVYLPFVEPLRVLRAEAKEIDIGCGRGEWLELLEETGFDAQGVDLDDGMLAACRQLGLKVQTQDAIGFLKSLPDASQAVVSGFHLVEHVPFTDLQQLVQQALRVLQPGGLLILETPNPENIVVGTSGFYLDPTHQRPIPHQLLSFLPEYYGFFRIKTLLLQEARGLTTNTKPTLFDVLGGVSPDYAIVAQKSAAPEQMQLFDVAFEKDYGLSIGALAQQYEARLAAAEARAEYAEAAMNEIRSAWPWRVWRWVKNKTGALNQPPNVS